MNYRTVSILLLLLAAGCTGEHREAAAPPAPAVSFHDAPAAPGSAEPNLFATAGGRVYLSWVASDSAGAALRYAVWQAEGWSAPRTVAQGTDWFVNWADFPSLVARDDGRLVAHFLQKSGAAPYAYDVRVTQSADGATWTEAITPHTDGTQTEHGFVSMLPWADGRTLLAWLDGRHTGGGHGHGGGAMTLRSAFLAPDGTLEGASLLDDRVCDCCQTDAAITADGAVVVYRDRTADERRDISAVRLVDGRWTEPVTVHEDNWTIAGCPVNGPAVAASGTRVATAWFTAADDTSRLFLAFSEEGGASFGPPLRVDDGQPVGRVDLAMRPDGSTVVSWIEATDTGADLRVRFYDAGGAPAQTLTVAETATSRAAGFPRLAATDEALYLAWTEPGEASAVRTAKVVYSARPVAHHRP